MDLSDLRIFAAVVREGGVTKAAQHLHRVQSNVTTRIRQLESDLGVQLFIRAGKRLHLAPAGETLLGYADKLLSLAEEAEAAVHDSRPRGTFRLGAMESTAAVRLPGPLAEYSGRYPDVLLELRTGNPTQLSQALLAGEIDAALVAEPLQDERFECQIAFVEEAVIVTRGDFPPIDQRGSTPKTIIVFENGCPHRRRLEAWYEDRNQLPERILELGSYHAMLGCVLAGMGAALLPKSVLETFPESTRLRVQALPGNDGVIQTLLIWRAGVDMPNVRALAEILGEETA